MTTATEALTRIDAHIETCADNYNRIDKRLWRIEAFVIAVLLALVGQGWFAYNNTHPATVTVPVTVTQPVSRTP